MLALSDLVATSLIGVGAVIAGTFLGGWITLRAESLRSKAAIELEDKRYQRERETEQRQALGAARVLQTFFVRLAGVCETCEERQSFAPMLDGFPQRPADDVVESGLRNLTREEAMKVATALIFFDNGSDLFRHSAQLEHEGGTPPPHVLAGSLPEIVSVGEHATHAARALVRLSEIDPTPPDSGA